MSYLLKNSVRRYVQSLAAGAASLAFMPGTLLAQDIESPAEQKEQTLEEIVVTGTLIRGVGPSVLRRSVSTARISPKPAP
ncbi:MAG: hypothetical protein IPG64_12590 [Haliea sp.]|nr:hypothetical protein [Haliea sp.]